MLRIAALAPQFRCPLVVDPILLSTGGTPLLAEEARAALLEHLLPRATLITPNLQEAAELTGCLLYTSSHANFCPICKRKRHFIRLNITRA